MVATPTKLANVLPNCYPFTRKPMRKEVILAVIIGIILGGVILYGINLANTSSKINQGDTETEKSSTKVTPSSSKKPDSLISILFPTNNSVVTENQLTIKGTTKPNSNIAIISESDDILTMSDKSGNFSEDINLIPGENTITITIVDEKQATSSSIITVIRTTTLPE
ncbi:TPA: hypothetical protein DGD59_03435 [Candidatus Collierbacteria bacterium]|nr:hypothetical protein [Candidatus Collierbacteria bacterium]HCW31739.1 hypothetical protein [Candidatus Collierbacteria bacterium]